ncbi:MAG: sugar transferase, partial [Clostridia bacterium]|nr:sugar transferase [Clostridia bacterium]
MELANQTVIASVSDIAQPTKSYEIKSVSPAGSICYRVVKRVFDILFSVCIGIVIFPILLVIALLIRLDSPGKALYIQERVGKNGKPFRMLKFR